MTSKGRLLHNSCAFIDPLTNNEAEYEALITGLEIALDIGVKCIEVYGDSLLVVRQVLGIYEVRKDELKIYHAAALRLVDQFYLFKIDHIKRGRNSQPDALAKLAAALKLPPEGEMNITIRDRKLLPSVIDRQSDMTWYEVNTSGEIYDERDEID